MLPPKNNINLDKLLERNEFDYMINKYNLSFKYYKFKINTYCFMYN